CGGMGWGVERLRMKRTAAEIAEVVGARVEGDGSVEVRGVAAPERAGPYDLIYLEAAKHAERAKVSAALRVLAGEGLAVAVKTVLLHRQPKVAVGKPVAVVIGSDGFGYARDEERYWTFPQTGLVEVGDDVEIGANATIDCGSLDDTRIAEGVKLDNLVHVGHNVKIGAHTVIAAQTGISGS